MKILFNSKLKAMRSGEYVVADSSVDEFILDTEATENQLAKKQLQDIAKVNKVKLGKKDSSAVMLEKMEASFEADEKLPTLNEKPDSVKVAEIVAAGIEAETSDDDMVMQIIQAGVKYKVAHKLFEAALSSGGYRLTVKERKLQIRAILLDQEFQCDDNAAIEKIIDTIVEKITDTNREQALKCIRAYAREFEIEMPKAEKAPKGGLKVVIFNWIKENPTATEEDLRAFIVDEKEKDEKYVDKYSEILKLVRETVESLYEDEDEDGDAEEEEEEETED